MRRSAEGPLKPVRKSLGDSATESYGFVMETLSTETALELLTSSKVGHMAVVDEGVPYVSPVSYVMINGEFCFRTGKGSRTSALQSNPNVSIEV